MSTITGEYEVGKTYVSIEKDCMFIVSKRKFFVCIESFVDWCSKGDEFYLSPPCEVEEVGVEIISFKKDEA